MDTAVRGPHGGVVSAVGHEYCAPSSVTLTISKNTINDDVADHEFVITDADGNLVFDAKEKVVNLRRRWTLRDSEANPVLSIQRKLMSMHSRYKIFRGDSSNHKDLLLMTKKSSLIKITTELDVFMIANTEQESCEFKIKGCYFTRSCVIYRREPFTPLAQMGRKYGLTNLLLRKDTFVVIISPNVDQALIIALIVIIDEINHRKNGSNGVNVTVK